jgi:hypothetical protein
MAYLQMHGQFPPPGQMILGPPGQALNMVPRPQPMIVNYPNVPTAQPQPGPYPLQTAFTNPNSITPPPQVLENLQLPKNSTIKSFRTYQIIPQSVATGSPSQPLIVENGAPSTATPQKLEHNVENNPKPTAPQPSKTIQLRPVENDQPASQQLPPQSHNNIIQPSPLPAAAQQFKPEVQAPQPIHYLPPQPASTQKPESIQLQVPSITPSQNKLLFPSQPTQPQPVQPSPVPFTFQAQHYQPQAAQTNMQPQQVFANQQPQHFYANQQLPQQFMQMQHLQPPMQNPTPMQPQQFHLPEQPHIAPLQLQPQHIAIGNQNNLNPTPAGLPQFDIHNAHRTPAPSIQVQPTHHTENFHQVPLLARSRTMQALPTQPINPQPSPLMLVPQHNQPLFTPFPQPTFDPIHFNQHQPFANPQPQQQQQQQPPQLIRSHTQAQYTERNDQKPLFMMNNYQSNPQQQQYLQPSVPAQQYGQSHPFSNDNFKQMIHGESGEASAAPKFTGRQVMTQPVFNNNSSNAGGGERKLIRPTITDPSALQYDPSKTVEDRGFSTPFKLPDPIQPTPKLESPVPKMPTSPQGANFPDSAPGSAFPSIYEEPAPNSVPLKQSGLMQPQFSDEPENKSNKLQRTTAPISASMDPSTHHFNHNTLTNPNSQRTSLTEYGYFMQRTNPNPPAPENPMPLQLPSQPVSTRPSEISKPKPAATQQPQETNAQKLKTALETSKIFTENPKLETEYSQPSRPLHLPFYSPILRGDNVGKRAPLQRNHSSQLLPPQQEHLNRFPPPQAPFRVPKSSTSNSGPGHMFRYNAPEKSNAWGVDQMKDRTGHWADVKSEPLKAQSLVDIPEAPLFKGDPLHEHEKEELISNKPKWNTANKQRSTKIFQE